jgi:hypothetical protein
LDGFDLVDESRMRKSALAALYLAAARLFAQPEIAIAPSLAHTRQLHRRPGS